MDGDPDKFGGILSTRPENSSLQSYLCISRVAWKEPKQSFISRQRAYRFQNILLDCSQEDHRAGGGRTSQGKLLPPKPPLFILVCHSLFPVIAKEEEANK